MNTSMRIKHDLHKNQSGLISFLVVMVVMLVLTLIVMSYAKIVRREQLQTIDRQLNAQALYAAESAVNDAMNAINTTPALLSSEYNECSGSTSFVAAAGLPQDLGDGVAYSCLLVDTSPSQLELQGVNTQKSITTKLRAQGSVPITRLEISWDSDMVGLTNISGCPATGVFPPAISASCVIGALRFEIVPFDGTPDRLSLINNRAIGFLQPTTTGSSSGAYGLFNTISNQGRPQGVRCDGTGARHCTFALTTVPFSTGYIRLRSIYRNTPVTIRAFNGSNRVSLIDSQVEVDVTGRASGVVKRIKQHRQVNETSASGVASEFALQSTKTICKRFIFWPSNTSPSLSGVPAGPNDGNYCNPLND